MMESAVGASGFASASVLFAIWPLPFGQGSVSVVVSGWKTIRFVSYP
jgi:hypothetical protein